MQVLRRRSSVQRCFYLAYLKRNAQAARLIKEFGRLVQSRQALAQARIPLYKAVGGGWSESERARVAAAGR
jgi:outer membrane protein TolC